MIRNFVISNNLYDFKNDIVKFKKENQTNKIKIRVEYGS